MPISLNKLGASGVDWDWREAGSNPGILQEPNQAIPDSELWLHEPEAAARIDQRYTSRRCPMRTTRITRSLRCHS